MKQRRARERWSRKPIDLAGLGVPPYSIEVDTVDEKAGQGGGKDVARKSPKADFPSQLANPANYAGFALFHRLCYG